MAELLEYFLALSFSTLLAGGSVAVYAGVAGLEGELQLKSLFNDISQLANTATENGSSTATLTFPASTLTCSVGRISLGSGQYMESGGIDAPCSFSLSIPSGTHRLSFAMTESEITAVVD